VARREEVEKEGRGSSGKGGEGRDEPVRSYQGMYQNTVCV
jgi:hypothetical protein